MAVRYATVVAGFGARLKALREAHSPKLTQTQLGQLMGVGQSAVSQWERGETIPDVVQFARLAAILDLAPEVILEGTHPEFDAFLARRGRVTSSVSPGGVQLDLTPAPGGPTDVGSSSTSRVLEQQAEFRHRVIEAVTRMAALADDLHLSIDELSTIASNDVSAAGGSGSELAPGRRALHRQGTRPAGRSRKRRGA